MLIGVTKDLVGPHRAEDGPRRWLAAEFEIQILSSDILSVSLNRTPLVIAYRTITNPKSDSNWTAHLTGICIVGKHHRFRNRRLVPGFLVTILT